MSLRILECIEKKVLYIRDKRVMIDCDLAKLYGVSTKVINQAVKRNKKRFPEDFMFQLNAFEKKEVVTDCDHLSHLRFSYQLPYAFTEQGVSMLSSVLNSEKAIQVNIQIMRVFVRLRRFALTNKEFSLKLKELENAVKKHDGNIQMIFEALRQLMSPPETPKRKIGFHTQ